MIEETMDRFKDSSLNEYTDSHQMYDINHCYDNWNTFPFPKSKGRRLTSGCIVDWPWNSKRTATFPEVLGNDI
jgi:hypothetical protein